MVTLPKALLDFYERDDAFMKSILTWINGKSSSELQGPFLILAEKGVPREIVGQLLSRRTHEKSLSWMGLNCCEASDLETLEATLSGQSSGALFLDYFDHTSSSLQARFVQFFSHSGPRPRQIVFGAVVGRNDHLPSARINDALFGDSGPSILNIPPLRSRGQGILALAQFYARFSFARMGRTFEGFSKEAQDSILAYDWPGNDLELFRVLDRTALLSEKSVILHTDLWIPSVQDLKLVPSLAMTPLSPEQGVQTGQEVFTYTDLKRKASDEFELEYLKQSLIRNRGNVSAAAREARLDRSNFLRLLRKHGLSAKVFRTAA